MKKLTWIALLCLSLNSLSRADVVVYNTSTEALTFSATTAGNQATGEVKPWRGNYPVQTRIENEKLDKTTFAITTSDGKKVHEATAAYSQAFFLSDTPQGPKCEPVGWTLYNGQAKPRKFRLHNATTQPLEFEIVGASGGKSGQTLQPGESKDFDGSDPLRNERHTLRFSNGQELTGVGKVGGCTVLFSRKGKTKLEAFKLDQIARPNGIAK